MGYVLQEQGETLTIVGATSRDTGGAALAAFAGRENIDVFFMFPKGKVSPVQQRQMTTLRSKNTHAIAIDGSFDDCQNMVKAMFADHGFRDRMHLSAVNSINWGRIMAQTVYYFTATTSLGAPDQAVSFTVPTGNFGDIYAGYVARQMGLPIERLVVATKENDFLRRTLESGRYEMQGVKSTITPSMDIQISSNFERLLFEVTARDSSAVRAMRANLRQSSAYNIDENALGHIKIGFEVGTASELETLEMMKTAYTNNSYLVDPHTAVALKVAQKRRIVGTPMITLATAHPANFPATVRKATGSNPKLPTWTGNLMEENEYLTDMDNDLATIQTHIHSKLAWH